MVYTIKYCVRYCIVFTAREYIDYELRLSLYSIPLVTFVVLLSKYQTLYSGTAIYISVLSLGYAEKYKK